ncbi:uncharacterized protein LOC111330309 [Stylophora pistillata]|uniref:uncharacterized protein LOC111330309 n=1 Tax=Stylophora pistillata TaxID=50429 RepID=UPI000C046FB4|nr:uncharacterized protein LOC111330309 [Stylophora pistillata]
MWFGRGDYGHHSLDRYSAIAGMSAVGFTAIIPSFYRSTPGVLKVPRSRAAIFIAPALCGSIACFSWQYVVSDPIKRRKMECVSCAAIRGSLTLGLSGCVVPSVLIASLHFGGRTGNISINFFDQFGSFQCIRTATTGISTNENSCCDLSVTFQNKAIYKMVYEGRFGE